MGFNEPHCFFSQPRFFSKSRFSHKSRFFSTPLCPPAVKGRFALVPASIDDLSTVFRRLFFLQESRHDVV
ncbi:hypothetical protein [Halomonas garicola]|uniref:hypothetical protein n=1 Tax=Halomonas garicola TaxID=1690008 RepID=UPI00289B22E1|nr:hypothetical protein [Halomonas garicola]